MKTQPVFLGGALGPRDDAVGQELAAAAIVVAAHRFAADGAMAARVEPAQNRRDGGKRPTRLGDGILEDDAARG